MSYNVHDMTVFEAMEAVMRMHGNGSPFVLRIMGDNMDASFSGRGEDFVNRLVEISKTNPAVKEILAAKTYDIRNPWGSRLHVMDGWCEIHINHTHLSNRFIDDQYMGH